MKLSIVSHYYGNVPSVKAMLASFRALAEARPGVFDFVLIDDHSHEPMDLALFADVPGLRVFRIVEDVAWNMPAARNIGVHVALCDKVMLLDIDHVVDADQAGSLIAEADAMKRGRIARFPRLRKMGGIWTEITPHINSFVIYKADFLSFGGYEEQFSGHYGDEDKFFRICCKRNRIKEILFETRLVVRGVGTPDLSRDKSVNEALMQRLIAENASRSAKSMSYHWTQIFPVPDA